MTLSPWHVYIWGQLDSFHEYFGTISCFCWFFGILALCAYFFFAYIIEAKVAVLKIVPMILIPIAFLSTTVSTLLPDKKTFAAMIIAPAIVNSKPIQQDLPDLYKMGVEKLKEAMESKKENK